MQVNKGSKQTYIKKRLIKLNLRKGSLLSGMIAFAELNQDLKAIPKALVAIESITWWSRSTYLA